MVLSGKLKRLYYVLMHRGKRRPTGLFDLEQIQERLMNLAKSRLDENFFVSGRSEYEKRYGKVFSDDKFYKDRMDLYIEWRLFEFSIENTKLPLYKQPISLEDELTKKLIEPIRDCRQIVFEVIKHYDDALLVFDLVQRTTEWIYPSKDRSLHYFRIGSIVQAYVFVVDKDLFMGFGCIQHHHSIRLSLLIRKPYHSVSSDFYEKLGLAHVKQMRMQHVEPQKIYSDFFKELKV